MKKAIMFLVLITLALFAWPDIMKVSEIKAGMQGEGKTIFKDSQVEKFSFQVLGILEKFVPNKDLIIVELLSPQIQESGVMAGMSGSPLYIDGKIIGAVSYGFSFAKKPIAGVTPIEDIINTFEYNKPSYSIDIGEIRLDFSAENTAMINRLVVRELQRLASHAPLESLRPIQLLSISRGFLPQATAMLTPVFSQVQGSLGKDLGPRRLGAERPRLAPADAVSIPLVRGDFEYSASGTVTHVDQNLVYMFGHPFFNLGTVDFPMHAAEIITVVPSFQNSFKLAASRQMIGRVRQDRFSAVQGELGSYPYMIPMKVLVKNRNRSFNLEMVDHPLLTPALSYISLMNIFMSEFQQYGFSSLSINARVFVENEENIVIDDLYSGTASFEEFSNLMLAVNFFLMNNREKKLKIQKIDIEINGMETIRRSEIENVLLEKNTFLPGEAMNLVLQMKNERGADVQESLTLRAPQLKPGTVFYLMVADSASIVEFDSRIVRSSYFPGKVSQLIRAINNLRKNNRVYLRFFVPSQGLFIRGYEYANLPSSVRNVLTFQRTSDDRSDLAVSNLVEYQYPVSTQVRGRKIIQLKIREMKNE